MEDKTKPFTPINTPASVTVSLGMYLLVLTLLLVYIMINAWPETAQEVSPATLVVAQGTAADRNVVLDQPKADSAPNETLSGISAASKKGKWKEKISLFGYSFMVHDEARMLIIVVLGGAIGAMIHAIQSFIEFVGFRKFITSWIWWYIMRAPIGGTLALVFYFALRGGLIAGGSGVAEQLSVAGVASLSTLVGLFTEQAVKKLGDVFDTLFATREKVEEKDGLHDKFAPPQLSKISPETINAGTAERTLIVTGKNFAWNSTVHIDGTARQTKFKSETELATQLNDADVDAVGSRRVTVVNASGAESNVAMLMIGLP